MGLSEPDVSWWSQHPDPRPKSWLGRGGVVPPERNPSRTEAVWGPWSLIPFRWELGGGGVGLWGPIPLHGGGTGFDLAPSLALFIHLAHRMKTISITAVDNSFLSILSA